MNMYMDFEDWERYFLPSAQREGWNLFSLGTAMRPLVMVGDPRGEIAEDPVVARFKESYARANVHAVAAYELLRRDHRQEFDCLGMKTWTSA